MVKYKEFKIEKILSWQPQKEIDPLRISDLSVESDNIYPFYGQATFNNGIISYLSLKDDVLNNKEGRPTILIHSNNQNIVYLQTPFYLKDGHGATSVLQADFLNEKNALYIMTCIKKVITKKFTYNEKATKIALKNTYIQLPVNENDEIDYDFMERYIGELEEERISELAAYLTVSGLEDYNLTDAEKKALNDYRNGKVNYDDFLLKVLFSSQNGNTDIQQKHVNGKGDFVISSGESNNGIIGKSDIDAKIFDANTITVDMFGNACFRDFKYKMVTHARVFLLKFTKKELTVEEGIYLTSQFAYLKKMFSYSNMASWEKIKMLKVRLPIVAEKEIDYEFMNNFIKAQEKLAIKDVVDWKDKVINKTKACC